jgi:SusD family.
MANGYPIKDGNSGYDPENPYANRDPRLADNILYNGTLFKKGKPAIITGNYPNDNNETDDNLNAKDKSTRTGYYLKKHLRDDVSPKSSGSEISQYHIYPRIRYTELFLAYGRSSQRCMGTPKGWRPV